MWLDTPAIRIPIIINHILRLLICALSIFQVTSVLLKRYHIVRSL